MEKLSIEEKAKAYDKALERVKDFIEKQNPPAFDKNLIGTIFPELKESEDEDERMKKSIIQTLKKYSKCVEDGNDSPSAKDFLVKDIENQIAWLEKQNSNVDNANKEYWRGYREGKQEILDKYAELEKQGEQKPTLPKWKYKKDNTTLLKDSLVLNKCGHMAKLSSGAIVSDVWVLDYDELAKLPKEELEEQGEQKPTDKVEPKFKVGDWVVDNCGYVWKIEGILNQFYILEGIEGGESRPTIEWVNKTFHLWTIQDAKDGDVLCTPNGNTFIFKTIDGDKILDYCGLYFNKFFSDCGSPNGSSTHYDKCNYHPATKEQRGTLFAKMKEAGYEWDAEKKELKKIHIIDEGKAEMDYCFTKMMNGEKVSPTWSEEDEKRTANILSVLSVQVCWDGATGKKMNPYQKEIEWLKSLKQRIGWKPSDEQMEALAWALSLAKNCGEENAFDLRILYEQLEKLKGE